jgi:hypothetical protein
MRKFFKVLCSGEREFLVENKFDADYNEEGLLYHFNFAANQTKLLSVNVIKEEGYKWMLISVSDIKEVSVVEIDIKE